MSFTVSVHDQANPFQVQTANYTINFVPPSNLTFITQPSNTAVNQTITPAVRVQAMDNSGAVVAGLHITVTLSFGPGVLSGTLTQITDSTGVATFPNLSINAAGTADALQASAGAITATSNPFNVTASPPAPPTNVSGTQNADGAPLISWSASAGPGVIGYNVYRSTNQTGPFTLINSSLVVSTTFTDLNAPGVNCPSTTYYYFVTAVGTGNTESGQSNETGVAVAGSC